MRGQRRNCFYREEREGFAEGREGDAAGAQARLSRRRRRLFL